MKIAFLILLPLGLASTWGGLLYPSMHGYGYAGYDGWHNRPSFWYFNDTHTVQSRSVRGTGSRGAGTAGGK